MVRRNVIIPALSMFYGIIVRMQSEKGGKHNKPHIHAIYGEEEIVVAIDGEVLEGEGYFKIAPLS